MVLILSLFTLFLAGSLLFVLAAVDFRTRLLPDIYVFPFAALAIVFHALTGAIFSPGFDTLWGGFLGGGFLYAIRMAANHYYKTDTLGLGDVKLMGAAGLWLGSEHIFIALCLGALFGVLHGAYCLLLQKRTTGILPDMKDFSIPAGPGFIAGILIVAFMKFQTLPHLIPL